VRGGNFDRYAWCPIQHLALFVPLHYHAMQNR
jgi:hypothetical protein